MITGIFIIVVVMSLITGLYFSIKINPHSFSWVVSAVINASLAIFVYRKNRKNPINITFALFSLFMAIWAFAVFGLYIVDSEIDAIRWAGISCFGAVFTPPVFLHFVLAFTKGIDKKSKRLLYVSYGTTVVFLILNSMGLFITEVIKVGVKYAPKAGTIYTIWLLNFTFWMGYGMLILYKRYKTINNAREQNQLKYLLGGLVIVVGFCFTNVLLSFGIKIYPIAGFTTTIYLSIVAYAIVKHQLMDINIIIRKSIIYASLTAAIIGIYALIVGIFTGIFNINRFTHAGDLLINGLSGLIIAVVFLPLRNKIQFIVDKLFFKDKYDYQKTLRNFSSDLTSILDLEQLLDLVVTQVTDIMHIEKGYIMLLAQEREIFEIKFSKKINPETAMSFKLSNSDRLIECLGKYKTPLLIEETNDESFNELKRQQIHLSVPLINKNKLVGILNLGGKLSEDIYTTEDLGLLATVANQAAVAIDNARLSLKMRALEKDLFRADKLSALGTLSSSIAHEIKNPLASIKTFCQLVSQKFDDTKFRDKFNNIVPREIERMENVLGQLLNFGKFSKLNITPVNINNSIDDLLNLMRYEVYKQNINIIKKYDDKIPLIPANEEQVKQVFMNIILNALQSMFNGGQLQICTSRSDSNEKPESVIISIQDTGCGISEESMKNVFKPFHTTKTNGTGLGLSITQKIIKEHNGTIDISSELNKGTTVTVKLPANKPTL